MGNLQFKLVNGAILKEINRKKKILENHASFYLTSSSRVKKSLQKESVKHSVSIEIMENYGNSSRGRRAKAKEIKRCEQNLSKALEWGKKKYEGVLTTKYIEDLGKKIEPRENPGGFRDERVMISGSHILPSSPHKIIPNLESFLFNNDCLDNSLEKAFHAHFHLARIHPFFDGNGRVSRAIQNIVLEQGDFLPVNITLNDRSEYMYLIDKAIESRWIAEGKMKSRNQDEYSYCKKRILDASLTEKEKKYCCSVISKVAQKLITPEVYEFYNFLALKERDSLQKELDRIQNPFRKRG